MALAMSLWKETRTGEEIFGLVEPYNLDLYHPSIRLEFPLKPSYQ